MGKLQVESKKLKVQTQKQRSRLSFLLLLTCNFLLFTFSLAAAEPPVAYQPESFSGAVGSSFKVTAHASPTELEVGDSLVLTLRVTAHGPWQQPPRRPDLARLKPFRHQRSAEGPFLLELSTSDKPDRELPAQQAWDFDYRLRPRNTAVTEIPAIPFTYYNPRILFEDKRWLTTWSMAVPLQVKRRAQVQAADLQGAGPLPHHPDVLYQVADGPGVLRHDRPFAVSWPILVVMLLVPPGLCAGWYVVWRRLYPDAASQRRQRHSRAARQALQRLRALRKDQDSSHAEEVARVLATYLRQRLDLPVAEPTPIEVARHLLAAGLPAVLAGRVADFFRLCDAARFGPERPAERDGLAAAAADLVPALEKPPEPGRPS